MIKSKHTVSNYTYNLFGRTTVPRKFSSSSSHCFSFLCFACWHGDERMGNIWDRCHGHIAITYCNDENISHQLESYRKDDTYWQRSVHHQQMWHFSQQGARVGGFESKIIHLPFMSFEWGNYQTFLDVLAAVVVVVLGNTHVHMCSTVLMS